MGILQILWTVIVGFVVGLVARAVLPGEDKLGFIMTAVLGIAGSFAGGFIGSLISGPQQGSMFHPTGFLMSIVGAVVLLLLWRFVKK